MGSYIAKASKDLADRRFDQGDSEKRKYDPDEADEKEDKKLDKREQGIARAAKKITKEDYVDEAMMVTNADKKGNTPAYQGYKSGKKGKDGKPMYKAADHMKEEEVDVVQKLIDSGKFTKEEIESIINS